MWRRPLARFASVNQTMQGRLKSVHHLVLVQTKTNSSASQESHLCWSRMQYVQLDVARIVIIIIIALVCWLRPNDLSTFVWTVFRMWRGIKCTWCVGRGSCREEVWLEHLKGNACTSTRLMVLGRCTLMVWVATVACNQCVVQIERSMTELLGCRYY